MDNSGTAAAVFVVASFVLAFVLISRRDSIAPPLKRWLALAAIGMVALSFLIILYSFFHG